MSAKRAVNIYNMLPGDDLVAALHKSFSGPALEQKLEIVRQLQLYNNMYDESLTLGEYEDAYIHCKGDREFVEESE